MVLAGAAFLARREPSWPQSSVAAVLAGAALDGAFAAALAGAVFLAAVDFLVLGVERFVEAVAALNLTTLCAPIFTAAPVRGLRPVRPTVPGA